METEETTSAPSNVWEYVEAAPAFVGSICDLWSWSLNYDWKDARRPFPLFCDLVGYSLETYGDRLSSWGNGNETTEGLGWMELDKLGKALCEYADRPRECDDWLDGLFSMDDD